jgi:hypothetical protein
VVTFHPQHERAQMLDGGIAIYEQYPGRAFGKRH